MSAIISLSPSDVEGLSMKTLKELESLATEQITTTTVSFFPTAMIVYFAILYFSAKGTEYIFTRRSRTYNTMSAANQRTSVIYILNIFYTTVALALQLYASPALAQLYTEAGTNCIRIASVIISGLYIFEMIYRDSMRWPMLAHHFSTIFAICFVNIALDKTWHPAFIVTGLCWLFQATTEQSIFAALLMYRLKCKPKTLVTALRFSAIQSFIPKFVFAIYLLVWWGEKQMHNKKPMDIAFSVILFVAISTLQVTQVYGSWVVWCIATKVKRDSLSQAMDLEKPVGKFEEDKAVILEIPHFLSHSARTDSSSSSITCAEDSPKLAK